MDSTWVRILKAQDDLMRMMDEDSDRLAERLGVTREVLDHFGRTMDYDYLARRIWEARLERGQVMADDAPQWLRDEFERAFGPDATKPPSQP